MIFTEMRSNKYVDLKKIENFVRTKCYSEDIPKDKRKKTNFGKYSKNIKIVHGHLTYKWRERIIFNNHRKFLIPQYHNILPQSNTD